MAVPTLRSLTAVLASFTVLCCRMTVVLIRLSCLCRLAKRGVLGDVGAAGPGAAPSRLLAIDDVSAAMVQLQQNSSDAGCAMPAARAALAGRPHEELAGSEFAFAWPASSAGRISATLATTSVGLGSLWTGPPASLARARGPRIASEK